MISETVQLAVVGTIVPGIAAIGAIWISYRAGKKALEEAKAQLSREAAAAAAAAAETAAVADQKSNTIIEKAVEIHTLTNSNLSKVTESLNVAREEIAGLNRMVVSMVEAKRVADSIRSELTDKLDTLQGTVDDVKKEKE